MKIFKQILSVVFCIFVLQITKANADVINISVGAGGDIFSPANVSAAVGDSVVWTWVSGIHNVVSTSVPPGAQSFQSIITGEVGFQFVYVIQVAGTYNYVCQLHFGMNGTILAEPSSVTPGNNEIPNAFDLKQNYPNPFNPVTQINFSIPVQSKVLLTVFNLAGQEVTKLVNEELSAGNYNVNFDAGSIPSGVYFYRIQAGDFSQTRKMILIK